MRFCPVCKRLVPKGSSKCPFCSKSLPEKQAYSFDSDRRRGFVRVSFENIIKFQALSLDPQGKSLSLEGKAKNISLTGIYFEVDEPFFSKASAYLKVSNIIWMEFKLPGESKPIKTQGEIRRVWRNYPKSSGLGVMFINISKPTHRILERFIASFLQGKEEI